MHSITFAIPRLFNAGSSPVEKEAIRKALATCERTLRSLDRRCRVQRGGTDQVVFLLPHVFHASSDLAENAAALEPLLECLCDIDLAYRQSLTPAQLTPISTEWLSVNPVYYDRTVVWDSTPALYARGYGDCKSLACARVSEYRAAGLYARPFFRFLPPDQNPKGQFQYHILVHAPDGSWEDPSKEKGMEQNENSYFSAVPNS
jgi:hypothetical protein